VNDDSGRFVFDYSAPPPSRFAPELYGRTEQGQWFAKVWGQTNSGSLCPSAPERLPKYQSPPVNSTKGWYPGSVNSAWVMDAGWNELFWVVIQNRANQAAATGRQLCEKHLARFWNAMVGA
jgi:hypothetical protein